MRSGLNIFLLIGAIVTNIVVCDVLGELTNKRDEMVQVIKDCHAKSRSRKTTAPQPVGIDSPASSNPQRDHISIAVDDSHSSGTINTSNGFANGNLRASGSPLDDWVRFTTARAFYISGREPFQDDPRDYSTWDDRYFVFKDLAMFKNTFSGNEVQIKLTESLISALRAILQEPGDYVEAIGILEKSVNEYPNAEEARARAAEFATDGGAAVRESRPSGWSQYLPSWPLT